MDPQSKKKSDFLTDPEAAPSEAGDTEAAQSSHLQRVALIGQLAAEMAHEIRQPLAAIRNFSEAALNRLQEDEINREEIEEALATIFVQAGRAQQITRRVTSYARDSDESRDAVDLTTVIQDVLPLIDFDADRNQVDLTLDCEPDLPPVTVNLLEIEQVLVNLLRNAIESVAARNAAENRRVAVRVQSKEGVVKVEVADTGTGIQADQADRIFEKFFTTKSDGLGLGLAVSRDIIEHHGGRLWALPNQDGGATFCFTIPQTRTRN